MTAPSLEFGPFLRQHLAQEPSVELLSHYTTQRGMLGILESGEFWASNIFYLNDLQEFRTGVNLIMNSIYEFRTQLQIEGDVSNHLERSNLRMDTDTLCVAEGRLYPSQNNIYIGSWSARSDDLGQWRAYSRAGTGFEIRMKWKTLKELADAQDFMLVKCIYDPEQQKLAVKDIVEESLREVRESRKRGQLDESVLLRRLLRFAPLFKHSAFKEEEEWRLISSYLQLPVRPQFGVREGRSMPVPFIRFRLKDPRTSTIDITEIRVGPCAEPFLAAEATHAAMRAYLPSYDPSRTTVSSSSVPYRNW